jgi:SAM-dependent methyltransferase
VQQRFSSQRHSFVRALATVLGRWQNARSRLCQGINTQSNAMISSIAANPDLVEKCLAALKANPADLDAHNTLERTRAPGSYASWMNINCVIDTRDDIFRFFANHDAAKNPLREYLSDGWRTLAELMIILETLDRPLLRFNRILEFASGFGRFTRHLAPLLPGKVTCADVMPGSMEFARSEFGVETIDTSHDPQALRLSHGYDLIFVLSMFTHFPPAKWVPWLKALRGGLAPNGILIFSVCNEDTGRAAGLTFDDDGTHFIRSSESPSLDADVYGTTYTTRAFVEKQVRAAFGNAEFSYFTKAFWAGQDAVAISFA